MEPMTTRKLPAEILEYLGICASLYGYLTSLIESVLFQNHSMFAGPPLRQNILPGGTIFDAKTVAMVAHHGALLRTQSTVSESKDKYKTELCIPFMEHGKCEQVNCQFAHGEQDLRTVQRDPNYKTILCKNFHSASGFCKHGSRCTYVHNEPMQMKLKRSMSNGVQGMLPIGPHSSPTSKILSNHHNGRSRFESTSDGASSYSSGFSSGGNSPSHSPDMSFDHEMQDADQLGSEICFGYNLPSEPLAPYLTSYSSPLYYPSDPRSFRSSRLTSLP